MFIGSINITNVKDMKYSKNNYTIGIEDDSNDKNKLLIQSFNLPYKTHFYANNVCSLEEFIKSNSFTVYTANKMLISIYNQLNRLHREDLYVSFLYPSNNDTLHIYDIYDKESIFIPPEFKSNIKIPFIIHTNTAFYSLAIVVLYSMKKTNTIFHDLSFFEILDYYKMTKMYYILNMCLSEHASDRHFIIF